MKKNANRAGASVPLLLRWFARNSRDLPWRRQRGLYAIWLSEVMLQQTQVSAVLPYYREFLRRFPSLQRLATASLQQVLKAWEGLGYYSRARNFWLAARQVYEKHHGRIPKTYEEFRALSGVGDYIAAAVLSIGCNLTLPVVDGNVLRVVCRWQGIADDIALSAAKRKVASFLAGIIPARQPGRFNEALMELGALVCLPRDPRCQDCPLRAGCFAFSRGLAGSLPVKSRKKPVPTHRVALAVIIHQGKIFIQQRPEIGHLGGLWEFPGGKCRTGEKPERAVVRECQEELGVTVDVISKLGEVRHAYSHFKIVLHVFICKRLAGRARTRQPHAWIGIGELGKYPFPAANHKFFSSLKAYLEKR
ncbi:MAG: A/G-specific adenine glycosylase [Candidatus Aminicenantes bacterium]|nr:A/G-specific adenine glycosylase [Candidatus Aminicenantes bacterium]